MALYEGTLLFSARQLSAINCLLSRRLTPLWVVNRKSSTIESEEIAEDSFTDEYGLGQVEIDRIRNVSGLSEKQRNRMSHVNKIPVIVSEYQKSLKYQRKLYARFGKKSGIDPRIAWPTSEEELNEKIQEECELEPSLQEMWAIMEMKKRKEQDEMRKREELVAKNMAQMGQWIEEHYAKLVAKEAEARKQQEKREKLLEEAREYFGYDVDPRDAKFEEMMAAKEKEKKKAAKARKKQEQAARLAAQLKVMADETAGVSDKTIDTTEGIPQKNVKGNSSSDPGSAPVKSTTNESTEI